jgi:hypothetical protein
MLDDIALIKTPVVAVVLANGTKLKFEVKSDNRRSSRADLRQSTQRSCGFSRQARTYSTLRIAIYTSLSLLLSLPPFFSSHLSPFTVYPFLSFHIRAIQNIIRVNAVPPEFSHGGVPDIVNLRAGQSDCQSVQYSTANIIYSISSRSR